MDSETENPPAAPAQLSPKERAAIRWVRDPLPDPTYNPRVGWKLDEFAMYCEPDGLREYKLRSCKMHFPHVGGRISFIEYVLTLEFPAIIQKRLLEPRFLVTGFRPGAYEPEDIPLQLLEALLPVIELSELFASHMDTARRRYEHVRVFKLNGTRGAQAKYDWRALARKMEEAATIHQKDADLARACRANVLLASGEKPDPLPDDATTRAAITKYGLWKFSLEKGKGSGKKRPG
jgi:hypothetical protein